MYMIIKPELDFWKLAANTKGYYQYGEPMATVTNGEYTFDFVRIGCDNIRINGYYNISKFEWIDYATEGYETFEKALKDIEYVKEKLNSISGEIKEPGISGDFEI